MKNVNSSVRSLVGVICEYNPFLTKGGYLSGVKNPKKMDSVWKKQDFAKKIVELGTKPFKSLTAGEKTFLAKRHSSTDKVTSPSVIKSLVKKANEELGKIDAYRKSVIDKANNADINRLARS